MFRRIACFFVFLLVIAHVASAQTTDWDKLNEAGEAAFQRGQYADAEKFFLAALKQAETFGGARLARSLYNLAELFRNQGKYAEAEPLYRRSLAIWEKTLGPEHASVSAGLNNLAELYRIQRKYAEAEPLQQRSLAIREKALGPQHAEVAQSVNNLAGLYSDQGKYAEAEPLFRRSLAIWEKALGPEHPGRGPERQQPGRPLQRTGQVRGG